MRLPAALLLLSVLAACGGKAPVTPDAGTPVDAGRIPDAGVVPDAGITPDAGTDGGTSPQCTQASDCPGEDSACAQRTCTDGVCGTHFIEAGTPVQMQTPGDCQQLQCDGQGNTKSVNDDLDLPDDHNPCTQDSCTHGTPTETDLPATSACGNGMQCDGNGQCVGCLADAECGASTECVSYTCNNGVCGAKYTAEGTPVTAQTPGDCQTAVCNGNGGVEPLADDTDAPSPTSRCVQASCRGGSVVTMNASAGSPCEDNGGFLCDGAGACVQCVIAADCPGDDTECQARTCINGVCGLSFTAANTPVSLQTAGDCMANVCDGQGGVVPMVQDNDTPAAAGPCQAGTCSNGVPGQGQVTPGTTCGSGLYCDANGSCGGCLQDSDCGANTECAQYACVNFTCTRNDMAAGFVISQQSAGDCQQSVCNGMGGITTLPDDSDTPMGTACAPGTCMAGTVGFTSAPARTACNQNGGSLCDGNGACVPCLAASDCAGTDTACQTRTCLANGCGFSNAPLGKTVASASGDCHSSQCDGNGNIISVIDNTDVPVDNNQCTQDVCSNGVPSNPPTGAGTSCSQNGGTVCSGGGACVQCVTATDCPGTDTECRKRACNAGVCGTQNTAAGYVVSTQAPGDCHSSQCDGNGNVTSVIDDHDVPVDNNQCTQDVCTSGVPSNPPTGAGTSCSQNGGAVCSGGGACVECISNTSCSGGNVCVNNTCQSTVLVLGSGTSGTVAGELHPGGAWSTTSLSAYSVNRPSISIGSNGQGVGLIRFTQQGNAQDQAVEYTTWSPGNWSAFTQLASGVTSQDAPAMDVVGQVFSVLFHGTDYKYYYAAFANGTWSPTASATNLVGPAAPALAALPNDLVYAYVQDSTNNLVVTEDINGSQGAARQLATDPNWNFGPTLVRLNGGTSDLMVAYVSRNNAQINTLVRSGGVWSAPAAVTNATTGDTVALAALPNGEAILAFRGQDSHLYWSQYTGGAWSSVQPFSSPNVTIVSPPALTHGASGATAEIAFVESDGVAYHARLVSGAWTTPVAVGGSGLSNVAITSAP